METDKSRPFVLYVAEIIYQKIYEIKIKNPNLTNIQAFEIFIASDDYNEISSGNFHDKWFKELESNDYVDKSTKKKINEETIRLLQIQKDTMIKQLMNDDPTSTQEMRNNISNKMQQSWFKFMEYLNLGD